jgi:pilus assembly protein TadC
VFYERIGALLPRKLLKKFKEEFNYLGIEVNEKSFLGFLVLFSAALSVGLAVNLYYFFDFNPFLSFPVLFFLFIGMVYVWLGLVSESKGRFVEKILPDALQLIASNIKAGLTTERALFVSARPEFGPLEKELKTASKEILSGERIATALLKIPERIHSKVLSRTVWLISKGIESGGQIADLLMKLSNDLREQHALQEEVKASVSIYVLLIFFASSIGAPALLGVSTFIVEALQKQTSSINLEELGAGAPKVSGMQFIGGPNKTITPEFVGFFSVLIILVGAFFASLTIGVINSGSEKPGIKFFPLLLLVGVGVFFVVGFVLRVLFANLI